MSFQPVVPQGGISGWKFLQRTQPAQFEAFRSSPRLEKDIGYFRENIAKVGSAKELVADRRLLSVALGAFGLQDDLPNRYLIQKILEDGTAADDALANRLADTRYAEFSDAFGFGPGRAPMVANDEAMAEIGEMFLAQSFEVAVGEQDDSMRIALFAQRELAELARSDISDDAKWFRMMGLPPLRKMFETALGLPTAFGQIDIDKQLDVFRDKSQAVAGIRSFSDFSDPDRIEQFTMTYLARAQINLSSATQSAGSIALAILRSATA